MIWLLDLICTLSVLSIQGSALHGTKYTLKTAPDGVAREFGIYSLTVSLICHAYPLRILSFDIIQYGKVNDMSLYQLCIQLEHSALIPRFHESISTVSVCICTYLVHKPKNE